MMPSSVADRLRLALETEGMSIRGFHKEISGRGVAGGSYPVIHRYLKGQACPPLEFVQGAAEILNIRPEWLAFGSGPLRPDHEEDDHDRTMVLREALTLVEHLRDLLREAI